jgi:hypothetical protein
LGVPRGIPDKFKPTFSVESTKHSVRLVHVVGHKRECQEIFTPEFLEHNGQTNSDNVEHGWAIMNGVGAACCRMTPGLQSDTLDDHLAHYNWMKTDGLVAPNVFLRARC